jgi:hypothetical protein
MYANRPQTHFKIQRGDIHERRYKKKDEQLTTALQTLINIEQEGKSGKKSTPVNSLGRTFHPQITSCGGSGLNCK